MKPSPREARRALVIVKPKSGQGNADLAQRLDQLRHRGFDVALFEAALPDHLSELILEHHGGSDLAILGGGGTMSAAAEAARHPSLGTFPSRSPFRGQRPSETEHHIMNWDQVEGNWKQFRGKVQQKWGELSDDELDQVKGRRDQLVGTIQKRYGIAREEAERQVKDWERTVS